MGKYNGAVITAAGQNLIAQAIAESKTVAFTTAQASSHVYPSSTDFEALTALTDVEKTVDINYAGVYSDTVVQVSARFDNTNVETAYLINTLGFFAQIGTGTPILFAVSTAVTPDQMPVFDADNPSAFIYNMQITVQNANSINLSVNPAGTVTVDQLNAVVSTINAKIGDLSDLTTEDKTSLINSINEVDEHADMAQASANNAQQMLAPIQSTLVASKAYAINEQFIYNGLLYKTTAAIAQDEAIIINGNCELADCVTGQIIEVETRIGVKFDLIGTLTSTNTTFTSTQVKSQYRFVYFQLINVAGGLDNIIQSAFVPTSTFTYGKCIQLVNPFNTNQYVTCRTNNTNAFIAASVGITSAQFANLYGVY